MYRPDSGAPAAQHAGAVRRRTGAIPGIGGPIRLWSSVRASATYGPISPRLTLCDLAMLGVLLSGSADEGG
ncbi:MAG: hypothetical protein M3Z50_11625 [Actinomycetota bacterium]|nr:hypothetical protein [Actinomycetota bacterium]